MRPLYLSGSFEKRAGMKVQVKDLPATIEIKNRGIELSVHDTRAISWVLGVTRAHLIWCQVKTARENGQRITWKNFIDYMQNHSS
jgi:hypothetical protein